MKKKTLSKKKKKIKIRFYYREQRRGDGIGEKIISEYIEILIQVVSEGE